MTSALALLLASALLAHAADAKGKSEMSQNITVVGRAAAPALAVPPPSPSKPVVDEVLRSLALGRGEGPAGPEVVHVSPESFRLERPFPDAPFLALSPENIHALYDSWTFEVLSDDGEIATRSEGVSILRESIDWDGSGLDGRLVLIAGRRYRYRFTGRRGGREFVVESDPVLIKSFTRREYAGETRLEAAIEEIFTDKTASYATGAERYLDAMADALRAGDARADGTYRFELYTKDPRGKLAAARAKALAKLFGKGFLVEPARVKVQPMPVERGEALAAFVPPAKGPRIGNE
ncbi:MAG TPA: hypothetical protein VN915_15840 [Elusimicrobiota bacterium]|nr:hypothetical protein [Elusimicrobiota bacterium]